VTNESLTFQLRDHRQRLFDRILRWFRHIADSKIDHIEPVAAEIFQVVVHAVDQLLVGTGMKPRVVGPSTCADFRHDHEALGIAEGHAPERGYSFWYSLPVTRRVLQTHGSPTACQFHCPNPDDDSVSPLVQQHPGSRKVVNIGRPINFKRGV
jgi:hypothetical protein